MGFEPRQQSMLKAAVCTKGKRHSCKPSYGEDIFPSSTGCGVERAYAAGDVSNNSNGGLLVDPSQKVRQFTLQARWRARIR